MVMERIKEALIQRTLKPGDRLPTENELCESLKVGKSSVREAVKMLEVLGIVETHQGEGTYIASQIPENSVNPVIYQLLIDYGSNEDILELRKIFEPTYTLLAMEKAQPEDLELIRQSHDHFITAVESGTPTAEDDLRFHYAILNATHNPFIIRIGHTIIQLFQASIGESMRIIPYQAIKDHQKIMDAFIEKDRQKLEQAVLASFEGWNTALMHLSMKETK